MYVISTTRLWNKTRQILELFTNDWSCYQSYQNGEHQYPIDNEALKQNADEHFMQKCALWSRMKKTTGMPIKTSF